MTRLLIIDDEPALLLALDMHFCECGFDVRTARSADEALAAGLLADPPDLLVSDIRMPGTDGLALLRQLRAEHPALPVIIMTAFYDMESTIAAMHGGAVEFIPKPIDIARLDAAVDQALRRDSPLIELDCDLPDSPLVGRSPAMAEIFRSVALVAQSRATVLITGESGTGKEVVARAIHQASVQRDKPFLAINCAALIENLLETELFGHARGAFTGAYTSAQGKVAAAAEGTLFLDEIAELSLPMQGKLLRLLEAREYSPVGSTEVQRSRARFMAATNVDLRERVAGGRFREDLYYRLNVVAVRMPALRERPQDIPLLVEHLLRRISRETGKTIRRISSAALDTLVRHDWPGNVRELENVLMRAAVLSRGDLILGVDLLTPSPLPARSADVLAMQDGEPASLKELERQHIERVLVRTGWHKGKTCEILGVSRTRLERRIREFGLQPPGEHGRGA
ncbi:sigma-54-dependent transcriptional regulator [Thauera mechernichensis]